MNIRRFLAQYIYIQLLLMIFGIVNVSVLASERTAVLQNGLEVDGQVYNGTENVSIGTRVGHFAGISLENWWYYQRALLRFDLSQIPPGDILSATLSLYIEEFPGLYDGNDGRIELGVYKLTQSAWDDDTADWSTYDRVNSWTNPGGDFEPIPVSVFTIDTVESFQDLWVSFDVTALVQEYIDIEIEPNLGMLIRSSTKVYPVLVFADISSTNISLRPKLEVIYSSEAPTADAGMNQNVEIGTTVNLNGSGSSDPNEPAEDLIYAWSFLSMPSAYTLTASDIIPNDTTGVYGADKPSFTADAVGTYEIELNVTNSLGLSDNDLVIVTYYDTLAINPHPRIWLTPQKIADLQAKATANTQQWQDFKGVADLYLERVKSGKRYYSDNEYIYTLALAYQITGDTEYADASLTVINDYIYPFDLPEGEPGYLGSYFARSYAVQLAIGYDWIYDRLSESDKVRLYEKMNEWAGHYFYGDPDSTRHPGQHTWAQTNPHNNFFYGRIVGGGLTAIATYGDNPRAQEWFDLVRYEKYENIAKPALMEYYKDGGWIFDGTGYGLNSWEFLFRYLLALRTAIGEDLFHELPGAEKFIYNIIHTTQPRLDSILPTGDTSTDELSDYVRRPMLILADVFRGTDSGEYAQWYLNHNIGAAQISETYYRWCDFLWYDPDAPERTVYDLPIDYFDQGKGIVYTRSDWDENSTWLSLSAGGVTEIIQDHQHKDQNAFTIFKHKWLSAPDCLIGGYGYVDSIYSSTILITDGTIESYQTGSWDEAAHMEKFESNTDYVYIVGQAAGVYRPSPQYSPRPYSMQNYQRCITYLRPDLIVILDRVSLDNEAYYPVWTMKSLIEPVTSGDRITITNGSGKLFLRTLLPSNIQIAPLGKGWDIRITNTMMHDRDHLFLTIFETADAAKAEMTTTRLMDSVSSNMIGAQIAGNKVVLFSNTRSPVDEVQYNIAGNSVLTFILCDMVANQYNIYKDGQLAATSLASEEGILTFNLPLSGDHLINVTSGMQALGQPGKPIHVD